MKNAKYALPEMSPAERQDLIRNARIGSVIGLGAGLAIGYAAKFKWYGIVLMGLGMGVAGTFAPIVFKLKKVEPKKDEPKAEKEKPKEPIPAPSIAMSQQMREENVYDMTGKKK